MPQLRRKDPFLLLAHFLDVLVRRGVEGGLAGGIGEGDLTRVADGDGGVCLLLAQRALAADRADDVSKVCLGVGVESRLALVTADGDGLFVGTGDGRIGRFAGDGADRV